MAERTAETGAGATPRGWVPWRARVQTMAGHLVRWAPRVTAEAGVVRWPGTELTGESAVSANRERIVQDLAYRGLKADAPLAFPADEVRFGARGAEAEGRFESRGAEVSGAVVLGAQPASLRVRFGGQGWLPVEAVREAEAGRVPGARVKLGDAFAAVRARGKAEWHEGRWCADVSAAGEPLPGKMAAPLEAMLGGQGDAAALTVETLHATLPGPRGAIERGVSVDRSGKFRPSGARVTVEADLAKPPRLAAKGAVSGEARLVTGFGQAPVVEFQLRGSAVSTAGWEASAIRTRGDFAWPRVRVSGGGAITGTAGERLGWRGGWDFATKEILAAAAEGQIRRATIGRWVPAGVGCDAVALKATAAGRPTDLGYAGRAEARGGSSGRRATRSRIWNLNRPCRHSDRSSGSATSWRRRRSCGTIRWRGSGCMRRGSACATRPSSGRGGWTTAGT